MIYLRCPDCGLPMDWQLSRVGDQPMLAVKCFGCDPAGPWHQEPVEILVKPRGKAPDTIPLAWAPCDVMDV